MKRCAFGDFQFSLSILVLLQLFFYEFIIYVVLDIFTRYHRVVFIFHGEIRYFRHGQGRDGMMQDSPASNKNYTLAFHRKNEIVTSKIPNYVLASIRATSGTSTLKIYTGILCSHSIYVIVYVRYCK